MKLRHAFPESDFGNCVCVKQPCNSPTDFTPHGFFAFVLLLRRSPFAFTPCTCLLACEKYPTRAVHDAAEFQMEKPSDSDAQAVTWSH